MENRFFSTVQRREIFKKFNHACAVCGLADIELLEADHFLAYENGGKTRVDNGTCLCTLCNRIKGNTIIPEYYRLQPRKPVTCNNDMYAAMQQDRKRFAKWLQMFKGARVPPKRQKAKWQA